nr:zinc finger, CCHC-type [Tanacetum cinerariifolium]
ISQLVSKASNLGSTIENKRLVRKLLGSIPTKFIQIVAAIEQFADLNTMTFQEATGKSYEERIKGPSKEEDIHDRLLYTKTVKKNKKNSIVVNVVVIGSRIRITKEEAAKEIGIKMFLSHIFCSKCTTRSKKQDLVEGQLSNSGIRAEGMIKEEIARHQQEN